MGTATASSSRVTHVPAPQSGTGSTGVATGAAARLRVTGNARWKRPRQSTSAAGLGADGTERLHKMDFTAISFSGS